MGDTALVAALATFDDLVGRDALVVLAAAPTPAAGRALSVEAITELLRQGGPQVGSAQHSNFMPQHQGLDVLGRRRATQQQQQVQYPQEDQTQKTQRHNP